MYLLKISFFVSCFFVFILLLLLLLFLKRTLRASLKTFRVIFWRINLQAMFMFPNVTFYVSYLFLHMCDFYQNIHIKIIFKNFFNLLSTRRIIRYAQRYFLI